MTTERERLFIQLGIGTGERAGEELASYLVDDLKLADDADIATLCYASGSPEAVRERISSAKFVVTHSLGAKVLQPGVHVDTALVINGPEKEHLHPFRTLAAFARMGGGHIADAMPWSRSSKKGISRQIITANLAEIRKDPSAQMQCVKEALDFSTLDRIIEFAGSTSVNASIFVAEHDKVAKHPNHYREKVNASGLAYFETADARHDTVLVEPAKVLTRAIMEELFPELAEDSV